jgi:hypothetical protein
VAGILRHFSKSLRRDDCVVGPGGMPQQSNFNGLHLQTRGSARIEPKGHFGAVTNRTLASPEGKGVTKPPAQKGQPPEDSQ